MNDAPLASTMSAEKAGEMRSPISCLIKVYRSDTSGAPDYSSSDQTVKE
jgi:hypothetical protein